MRIKLPLRPRIFSHNEYNIDFSSIGCTYDLLGTIMTPKVPSYINLVKM